MFYVIKFKFDNNNFFSTDLPQILCTHDKSFIFYIRLKIEL